MDWSSSQPRYPTRDSQDSAVGSCRALPLHDSQSSAFSQVATQDVFSQNNYAPVDAYKPSSLYEKWKSKQANLKRDTSQDGAGSTAGYPHAGPGSSAAGGTGYGGPGSKVMGNLGGNLARWDSKSSLHNMSTPIKSVSMKKQADSDDRKVLDHLALLIKDGNAELQAILAQLTSHMEKVASASNGQLASTMSSYLANIWDQGQGLKELIQKQQVNSGDVHSLEKKLVEKTSRISSLEEQLSAAREGEPHQYVDPLKAEINSFQAEFAKRIKDLQTMIREGQRQQQDFLQDFQANNSAGVSAEDVSQVVTARLKDTEKRVVGEVSKVVQRLETKQSSQQRSQHKDLRNDIEKSMGNTVQVIQQDISNQTSTLQEEIKSQLKSLLQSLAKTIKDEIEKKDKRDKKDAAKQKVMLVSVATETNNIPAEMDGGRNLLRSYTESTTHSVESRQQNPSYPKSSKQPLAQHHNRPARSIGQPIRPEHDSQNLSVGQSSRPGEDFRYSSHSLSGNFSYKSPEDPRGGYTPGVSTSHRRNAPIPRYGTSGYNTSLSYPGNTTSGTYSTTDQTLPRPLPIRPAAPFVSPFPPRSTYSHSLGPSPCAVVAPLRQTQDTARTTPVGRQRQDVTTRPAPVSATADTQTNKCSPPGQTHQSKKKKRRKSTAFGYRKKSKGKKCLIEGLSRDESYAAPTVSTISTRQQRKNLSHLSPLSFKEPIPIRSNAQRQVTQTTTNNSRPRQYQATQQASTRSNATLARQAINAYKFDDFDDDATVTPARLNFKAGRLNSQESIRSGISPRPKLPMNVKSETSHKVVSSDDESVTSSPTISVYDMVLSRRIKTPMKRSNLRTPFTGCSVASRPIAQRVSPDMGWI